jgi:hypothetical protein
LRPRAAVSALAGLYSAVALPLAARLDIWVDEAYTLETTGGGLRHALHQALFFEAQPPLYFLLLTLWRTLDGSIFFARLFSVLCGVGALLAVAALSRRWLPELHPGWLTALAGLNPFFFYAALEIRLYALALLLSALLLLLFQDGYLSAEPRRAARWGFGITALAALSTQYYLGFLLVAGAAALLALKRWRPLRDYLLAMAAVAVCFAPMLWIVPRQVSSQTVAAERMSIVEGVVSLGGRSQEYAWPTEGLRGGLRTVARLGFAAALAALALAGRRAVRRREVAVWTLLAVTALLFLAARVAVTGPHLMQPRHTAALYLPSLLAAASVVALIPGRRRTRILGVWTGGVILLTAVAMARTYGDLAKQGDWARVGSFLERNARPGEPVLVLSAEGAIPLRHYYGGPLIPLPSAEDFRAYDPRKFELRSEREIDAALARMPGSPRSLWLVTYPLHPDWLGIDYGFGILDRYLAKRYRVERDVLFRGTRVRHFTAIRAPLPVLPS